MFVWSFFGGLLFVFRCFFLFRCVFLLLFRSFSWTRIFQPGRIQPGGSDSGTTVSIQRIDHTASPKRSPRSRSFGHVFKKRLVFFSARTCRWSIGVNGDSKICLDPEAFWSLAPCHSFFYRKLSSTANIGGFTTSCLVAVNFVAFCPITKGGQAALPAGTRLPLFGARLQNTQTVQRNAYEELEVRSLRPLDSTPKRNCPTLGSSEQALASTSFLLLLVRHLLLLAWHLFLLASC